MIIDTSAVMAVLTGEPGAERLLRALASGHCRMSAATWLELSIVADARSAAHGQRLDQVLAGLEVEVVPVDLAQAQVARAAYQRFGRGSGSKARLNYGDCFAYALAITSGEPLLFVGDDFAHTDVARPVTD